MERLLGLLGLLAALPTATAFSATAPTLPKSPATAVATGPARDKFIEQSWLDLRRNTAAHTQDVMDSTRLGYARIPSLPQIYTTATPYDVPTQATGLGPACPFLQASPDPNAASLPLVWVSDEPLVSSAECNAIVDEAKAHLAAGKAGSGFTLSDTNHHMAVRDLPGTLEWLNTEGLPRVAALAGQCYDEEAIGDPKDLLIYRALVVGYEHAAGLTHQEVHRDGSLITCVINLSPREDYTGGGTYLEAIGQALTPNQGHALLQASALRHAGHKIESGERWVMVLFLISEELKYGEHVRHLKGRAQRLAEEAAGMPESRAGARKTLLADEAQAMNLARALCDDNDHELVYDQACGLHERGEFEAARGLYELADRICGGIDAKVQNNLREVMAALDVDGIAKAANALNEVAAEAAEMASLTEDCQSGVDVACDTLSLEDEAKKQWLKSMDVDGVQAAATELNNIVDKLASMPSDEAAKQEWLKQLDTPASTWGAAAKGVSAVVS